MQLKRAYSDVMLIGALLASCAPSAEEGETIAPIGEGKAGGANGEPDPSGMMPPGSSTSAPSDQGIPTVGLGNTGTRDVVTEDEACQSQPVEPKVIEVEVPVITTEEVVTVKPTALFLMLDRSASMVQGVDKWTMARTAISQFVNDPGSEGLQVALQYFPLDTMDYGGLALIPGIPTMGPGCQDVAAHGPVVPMGLLPDNAMALSNSLSSTGPQDLTVAPPPSVGTPIEVALNGLAATCTQFQADNPDWQCLNVLITDGQPTNCSGDINALAQIAGNAWNNNKVRTFTIGMQGADFAMLDRIAAQGQGDCHPPSMGTFEACDVTGGAQAFVDALKVIRESISTVVHTKTTMELQVQPLECEFGLPDPPMNQEIDPKLVNVQLTDAASSQTTIKQVDSEADCAAHGNTGWYYDNPAAPTAIKTCTETCNALKALEGAKVDVLLGCKTEPA